MKQVILWKLRLLLNLIGLLQGKVTDEASHLVEARTVNEFNWSCAR